MFEPDDHLFLIPPVATALSTAGLEFGPGFDTNAAGLDALDLVRIVDALTPALRAIILSGYRPWKLDIGTGATARIEVLLSHRTLARLPEHPTDPDLWTSGAGVLVVLIHAFPFHKILHDTGEGPGAFRLHKLPLPAGGPGWALFHAPFAPPGAQSATSWADLPEVEAEVVQLVLASADPSAGLAGSLAAGPVAALVEALLPALVTAQAQSGTENRGLLWLFDPAHWYPEPPADAEPAPAPNPHRQVMQKMAAHALLPAGSPDAETFLRQQIAGDTRADQVLLMATDRRVRSKSRARRFLRNARKWSLDDDAPLTPLPASIDLALDTLGWFDLLMLLTECGFIQAPALPATETLVTAPRGTQSVTPEPLIAQLLASVPGGVDDTVDLRIFATDGNPDIVDGRTDGYARVVRMRARAMPIPDQIDASVGTRSIQTMCTWEYIPANADSPTPRLLVVAGPGVAITLTETPLVRVEVLRKQDYGLPPWGAPIVVANLFAPVVVTGAWPATGGAPPPQRPAWIMHPRSDGLLIHLYRDLPEATATAGADPLTQEPAATILVTLDDILSGDAGFRVECDFACLEDSDTPVYPESTRPLLRLWQTADGVRTQVTRTWWSDFDGQFLEHDDLAAVFANFPHAVPVTVPATWWLQARSGDQMDRRMTSTRVRDPATLSPVMTVPKADLLGSRGFREIDAEAPGSDLIFDYAWTGIDWFLLAVDVVTGFTVVGNVIDVVEFVYAWNTGKDRWGRPVTELDLWMMGIGMAIPVAGSAVFRGAADGGATLGRIWAPPPQNAGTTAADEAQAMLARARAAQSVAADLTAALPRIPTAPAPGVASGLTPVDLLDAAGDGFQHPVLQREYRRWVSRQLAGSQ